MRVDRRGFAFGHGLQVRAVVPHGAITSGRIGERVAIDVGGGQPPEKAAEAGEVGAAAVGIQRRCLQPAAVIGAHALEFDRQRRGRSATTTGRGDRVRDI